jgi:hypothetical protein
MNQLDQRPEQYAMIQEAPSTLKTNISGRATISATLKNTVLGSIFIYSHPDPNNCNFEKSSIWIHVY